MVGAIDENNVVIEAAAKPGTLYHNYEGTFSIVLAICNAKYNFTLVDVRQYGSNNNSGVLGNLKISSTFENSTLNSLLSLAMNKSTYFVLSSGKCNIGFCVRIQEGFYNY